MLPWDPRFTDQTLDLDTGLYDFRARLYDPRVGRFLQPDPVVGDPTDPQQWHAYAYARNNPLAYVDPSGAAAIQILVEGDRDSVPVDSEDSHDGVIEIILDHPDDPPPQPTRTHYDGHDPGGTSLVEATTHAAASGQLGSGWGASPALAPMAGLLLSSLTTGLNYGGLVPGFGEPFDLLSAGLSAWQGDYVGAGLSLTAAVPLFGTAAGVAKAGRVAARGTTLIGHLPDYVNVAEGMGANYLKPTPNWNWRMQADFIKEVIERGDNVFIGTPIREGPSVLKHEIKQLIMAGYEPVEPGSKWLIKGDQ